MNSFRAISAYNDWAFGQGRGSYFRDQAAIMADIKTSLLFFLNDFFAAMNVGVDWWNLLGGKNPAAQNGILLQTRQAIIGVEGVVRINSVVTQMDAVSRRLTLIYNVDTVLSRSVVGSVTTP
jgi:hypothetical protein